MSNQIPGMLVSCTKMIYLEQVQMYNHKSVLAYYPLKVWHRKYAEVNVVSFLVEYTHEKK